MHFCIYTQEILNASNVNDANEVMNIKLRKRIKQIICNTYIQLQLMRCNSF